MVGNNDDGGRDCEKCSCFVGNLGCADNGGVLPLRSEQALFAIDGLRKLSPSYGPMFPPIKVLKKDHI